jgi:hypothetical protein
VNNAIAMQKDSTFKFGDFLFTGDNSMKVDFIVKGQPPKRRVSEGDTLYEDDKYIILGDRDKLTGMGIFKKYTIPYKFSSFKVPLYRGKLALPDFKTDPAALLFRTQIKQQCKQERINFGGHFTFVKWGCGSDCEAFAIVDRITGKINYSNISKDTNFDFVGFKYKPNSNMVIMNAWRLDIRKGYVLCHHFFKVKSATWNNIKFNWLHEP